jgi:hypothetical protein
MVVYGKNDSGVFLPTDGQGNARANGIFVDNGDVYVVGFNRFNGSYWKNEVIQPILNAIDLVPNYINVSAGDVYVAGDSVHDYPSNNNIYGMYLKNNVPVYSPACSHVTGLAVSGNDAYVAGSKYGAIAAYWKNGVLIYLTTVDTFSYTSGIAVSGNDVYVSGGINSIGGVYWKNGVPVSLVDCAGTNGITISEMMYLFVVHLVLALQKRLLTGKTE